MSFIATAASAASIIGSGVGIAGSLGAFGGGGGSAPQYITTTPYEQMQQSGQGGNFGDLANSNSTYLADMYSQLGTGQAPSYYQSYQNQAMPYQQGLNAQQYYGTPGNRSQNAWGGPSAMGNAMSLAAMFGLNPKATTGQANRVNQQYQQQSSAIDQYFAGQGYNAINQTAQNLPGWATGQQNSYTEANRPYSGNLPGVPAAASPWGSVAGAIGAAGGYSGIGSSLSTLFGGNTGQSVANAGIYNNTAPFNAAANAGQSGLTFSGMQ